MSKSKCNTLFLFLCLASAALLLVPGCAGDAELGSALNANNPGMLPPAPSPGSDPGPAPGAPAVQPSPLSAGAGESPASAPLPATDPAVDPPVDPSAEPPQPNATETNFFTAGCRQDSDCGATRRCQFPADAGAGSAAPVPDAGGDAGEGEPLAPPGRCVAR